MGLRYNGVGNHEFDEGVNELMRMQRGGCHPVDGCQDGDPFLGASFRFLASNVRYAGTDRTIFPPFWVKRVRGVPVVHPRPDARGHAEDRHARGRRRPGVRRRGRHDQPLRRACWRGGRRRRGVRRPHPPGRPAERARRQRLHRRQPLRQLHRRHRPDRRPPRQARRRRAERAHAPALRLQAQRDAADELLVVRAPDHEGRPHARPPHART